MGDTIFCRHLFNFTFGDQIQIFCLVSHKLNLFRIPKNSAVRILDGMRVGFWSPRPIEELNFKVLCLSRDD